VFTPKCEYTVCVRELISVVQNPNTKWLPVFAIVGVNDISACGVVEVVVDPALSKEVYVAAKSSLFKTISERSRASNEAAPLLRCCNTMVVGLPVVVISAAA